MKYVKVSWPEIQDFMNHTRWSECIFCQSIDGHEVEDSTYMIPEDLYQEVMNKLIYPFTISTNLGNMVVTPDSVKVNNVVYSLDESELKKGSEVLLYSPEENRYWTTICTAWASGFPPVFADSSTLIDTEIIGIKNN